MSGSQAVANLLKDRIDQSYSKNIAGSFVDAEMQEELAQEYMRLTVLLSSEGGVEPDQRLTSDVAAFCAKASVEHALSDSESDDSDSESGDEIDIEALLAEVEEDDLTDDQKALISSHLNYNFVSPQVDSELMMLRSLLRESINIDAINNQELKEAFKNFLCNLQGYLQVVQSGIADVNIIGPLHLEMNASKVKVLQILDENSYDLDVSDVTITKPMRLSISEGSVTASSTSAGESKSSGDEAKLSAEADQFQSSANKFVSSFARRPGLKAEALALKAKDRQKEVIKIIETLGSSAVEAVNLNSIDQLRQDKTKPLSKSFSDSNAKLKVLEANFKPYFELNATEKSLAADTIVGMAATQIVELRAEYNKYIQDASKLKNLFGLSKKNGFVSAINKTHAQKVYNLKIALHSSSSIMAIYDGGAAHQDHRAINIPKTLAVTDHGVLERELGVDRLKFAKTIKPTVPTISEAAPYAAVQTAPKPGLWSRVCRFVSSLFSCFSAKKAVAPVQQTQEQLQAQVSRAEVLATYR